MTVRKLKLSPRLRLSLDEAATVIIFVSSMLHRTKLRRDKEKASWGHMLAIGDDMLQNIRTNPSKYIKRKRLKIVNHQ